MATYAFLRGWIHAGHILSGQVRHIVETVLREPDQFGLGQIDVDQLLTCWHFPTADGPAEGFVLLGATVKECVLPVFEAQCARIAQEVVDVDFDVTYNIVGRIEVTLEGQDENEEWIIADGRLDRSGRRPYFL